MSAKLPYLLLLLLSCAVHSSAQEYQVTYSVIDTVGSLQSAAGSKICPLPTADCGLPTRFPTRNDAVRYFGALPPRLQEAGYISASLDTVRLDSLEGRVILFLGHRYRWAGLSLPPAYEPLLARLSGPAAFRSGTGLDLQKLGATTTRLLDHFEEEGHPFARIWFDSLRLEGGEVYGALRIEEGPAYKVDSMRLYGDGKVSRDFLQRYLGIPNGSPYRRSRLLEVDRRLSELSYVQVERPSDLSMLGSGSVLNLYLKAKRSSQINALVGLLPNSDRTAAKRFGVTADVNLLLRNALGGGETLGLVWQQLQLRSPRLNLLYEQPYLFRSPFGLRLSFDMFRKDSSFLNLNAEIGATYRREERRTFSVFLQRRQSIISNPNTAYLLQYRRLPQEGDVRSLNLGVGYAYSGTDYRFNPRKGWEGELTASGGTKKLKPNTVVQELKDPTDPTFSFGSIYDTVRKEAYGIRFSARGARFFPVGRQSAFRLGGQGGWYRSPLYFRNELFQIGGYKTIRGFDEESQYVSAFAIGSAEYRYLVGANSFFFLFADGGWGAHELEAVRHHGYFGTGLGLSFETGAGTFNLAWAVGRRDDAPLNLRQSKVHLGFVNYF